MVKKFTRTVKDYTDETERMAVQLAKPRPGRPVKGQVSRGSYAIAWGDLRRIWLGLKAAGRCPVDERAHDAIKDALLALQRRTNGALELAEDNPMPASGPRANKYEITWPNGDAEIIEGAAAVASAIGVSATYLSSRAAHGNYVKRVQVWDDAAQREVTKEITVRKL